MPLTLILPTPLSAGTNNTWGGTLNTAFGAIETFAETQETDIAALGVRVTALESAGPAAFTIKTADENRTSTTLTDDTHLAGMTLAAGTWQIEASYLVSGPAAGDFKVAWAFSGTTTQATRGGAGPATGTTSVISATAANTVGVNRSATAGDTSATITSATQYGLDGTNVSWIYETGILIVSVSGTFKIQTAQAVASGTTVVKAGSYVYAKKVA